MTNRSTRATIAKETVQITKSGRYTNSRGETVHIKHDVTAAIKGTIHYSGNSEIPDSGTNSTREPSQQTKLIIENCTTLHAATELVQQGDCGHIACLNFASAKNPGGGFLNGSEAQEESLARASALYTCIQPQQKHYDEGRHSSSCLYTDSMLFSPSVPVFRDGKDQLLDEPYLTSFITSPAVNLGALRRKKKVSPKRVRSVMTTRCEKVLAVALANSVDSLVLGAWGCGVFKNDPKLIAELFHEQLFESKRFSNAFRVVYLAVLDRRDRGVFAAFQQRFAAKAS